jgi:hypothetical protein
MEQEEADQLRSMEIQSIKGGLGQRSQEHGFGRCDTHNLASKKLTVGSVTHPHVMDMY